jgi:aldehyde dehydrogenase family protein
VLSQHSSSGYVPGCSLIRIREQGAGPGSLGCISASCRTRGHSRNASKVTGYVFTGDLARGLRLCERLQVGMIGLNRGLVSDPAAPFGGIKQSGLGREGGHEGIDAYLETVYVATNW